MRRSVRAFVALGSAVALMASACGSDGDDASDNEDTPSESQDRGNVGDGVLKIGTLVPQTGDLAAIEMSLSTPIDIAVEEINAAGGVFGADVEVAPGDDGTSPDIAATTYASHINSGAVDVILGPAPSGVAAKLADKFGTDKVPACSGSTTAADLSGAGDGYFFRTAPPDALQGPALASLITGDNHSNVAIVARNDDYGKGFSDALKGALEDNGATVTETVLYDPEGSNYDADVQKAIDSGPDAVAVIGFNDDGAKIINAMIGKDAGPDKVPTYTADGMQSSSFGETVDPNDPSKVAGIKGTAPAASPAGIEHPFQAKFAETGVDPIFSAYFYDCTILMGLAAVAADSDDGSKIAEAFSANLEGDESCSSFADCKALLEDGKTIHYSGASSDFSTWNVMEPGNGAYDIWNYDAKAEVVTSDASEQIKI